MQNPVHHSSSEYADRHALARLKSFCRSHLESFKAPAIPSNAAQAQKFLPGETFFLVGIFGWPPVRHLKGYHIIVIPSTVEQSDLIELSLLGIPSSGYPQSGDYIEQLSN